MTNPSSTDEAKAIHALIKKHRLPSSVKRFEVKFGEDSSGQPAVWIFFIVEDDPSPSKQKLSELNELVDSVTTDFLQQRVSDRWPYVRFSIAA